MHLKRRKSCSIGHLNLHGTVISKTVFIFTVLYEGMPPSTTHGVLTVLCYRYILVKGV